MDRGSGLSMTVHPAARAELAQSFGGRISAGYDFSLDT
jgi:hypothetical protein